jgi:hypothetical protein
MKKFNLFAFLFLIANLSLAGEYIVTNPEGMATYQKDDYACELNARMGTAPRNPWVGFDELRYEREKRELYFLCMQAKGYVFREKE